MEAPRIRSMLQPDMFQPFDVRTASGESYRVRSPDMAWMPPGAGIMMVYSRNRGVALIDLDQVVECVRQKDSDR